MISYKKKNKKKLKKVLAKTKKGCMFAAAKKGNSRDSEVHKNARLITEKECLKFFFKKD